MKKGMFVLMMASCGPMVAFAQAPAPAGGATAAPAPYRGTARDIENLYKGTFQQVIRAANTMPAEDFHFKPRPDAPSFANLVRQAIDSEHAACDDVNQTSAADRGKDPDESASKDEFMAALQVGSAACDKAYASMTTDNFNELRVSGNTQRGQLSILAWNYANNSKILGTMIEYLAEKGLKMPAPAGRGGR